MPFYEYQCPSCHQLTEVMQKISEAPLKKCPACGKAGLKRLISAPVFRLKGSGWYETDFKSDKEGKRNLAGRDAEESKAPASDAQSTDKANEKSDKSDQGKDKSGDKGEIKSESKNAAGDKPAGSKPSAPAKAESSGGGAKGGSGAGSGESRASKPAASKRSAAKPTAGKATTRRRAR